MPRREPRQVVHHGAHVVGLVHFYVLFQVALDRVEHHQRRVAGGVLRKLLQARVAHRYGGCIADLCRYGDVFHPRTELFQARGQHDVRVVFLGEVVHQPGLAVPCGAPGADVGGPFQRQPGLARARHARQNRDGIQRQIRLDQVLGLPRFHVRHRRQAHLVHRLAPLSRPRDRQAIAGVGLPVG